VEGEGGGKVGQAGVGRGRGEKGCRGEGLRAQAFWLDPTGKVRGKGRAHTSLLFSLSLPSPSPTSKRSLSPRPPSSPFSLLQGPQVP
jgi:hypothetical protein